MHTAIAASRHLVFATGLVDRRTGRPSLANIRRAIRGLTTGFMPWGFDRALSAIIAAARQEAEQARASIAARAEAERAEVERRADAERLAAAYDYDAESLHFEYRRRTAGSFTTTRAGSERERDRYCDAWGIARARQRQLAAAE